MPQWLEIVARAWLALSLASALIVAFDVWRGRRQKMAVMDLVWPLTGLYLGPFGLACYFWFGRAPARRPRPAGGGGGPALAARPAGGEPSHRGRQGQQGQQGQQGHDQKPEKPFWQSVFASTTHCGAGCTLGDFGGEWLVFLAGWTLFGEALWAQFAADFALAYAFGMAFQYFAIAPMRGLGLAEGLKAAIKADTLSIAAFEIGMFGWMLLRAKLLYPHPLPPTDPVYWVSMQVAMALGFATSYPVNWWLVKTKIKEAM